MTNRKKIHFEISERKILLRVFDVLLVLAALYFLSNCFQFDYFRFSIHNYYWTFVLAFYLLLFGTVFEMYNLQVAGNQFQIIKSIILTTTTTVSVYLLTPILTPSLPKNRLQIVFFYVTILGILFLWRMVYQKFLASHRFYKKVLFLADDKTVDSLVAELEKADPNYKVMGYLSTKESLKKKVQLTKVTLDSLEDFIRKHSVSEIVIANKSTDEVPVEVYDKLLSFLEKGIIIREYSQVYETSTYRLAVQFSEKDFYKYFPFSRSNQNKLYLYAIRLFDIVVSVIGLLVGVLFLPLLFIGNLLGNKGPLFYTQERVGKNGIPFKIYKFRSMVTNAEANGAVFAAANDSRVTPFGKFLRKSRIDEFPQFINILKGDMAVIGPRPERPVFVQQIAEIMPFYQTRHVIKPGLTGWAQVKHAYGETIDDSLIKLQYDLYYIKHRSLFLDVNIIVKTLSTVLFFRGQ
ncbi:glycosyl transferase family protein [Flavobacterium saliperosum S13]|uniref:Exopolysaccharide biosynthesis polyprenyl glycosylphosphotransferase n=2 Tax=Flavobacterium saliperosum TaxID=329186 RepID=A0A1G4VQZ1_9FLAO|nr:sugar transferase [Flavobacterium saliperosum]ESU23905.1 glycosyl transferase family protein [Flavobacterium saliperosum S13]SCX09988.1 exopolysaccharide biosynthesis polyprenyl glycosylphosphotransferase [Flavobacterium saliperosum]